MRIALPPNASKEDVFLARFLSHQLGDRLDLHPKTERWTGLNSETPVILMGSIRNPSIRQYCAQIRMDGSTEISGRSDLSRSDLD